MISLIQAEVVYDHHWMSSTEFTNILAISQMTPGPIGINSATYCGYTAVYNLTGSTWLGVLGSCTATFALMLPCFTLMVVISKLFMKYMNTSPVQSVFLGLRPAVVGLLAAATLLLVNKENFSSPENPWQFYVSIFLFASTFVGTKWVGVNPIKMILYAAFAGLVLL